MRTEHDKLVEDCARATMIAQVCGCTLDGERVFCDDARLPDDIRAECNCRETARALLAIAVERCAAACEQHSWARDIDWWMTVTKKDATAEAANECAAAIRALLSPNDRGA